MELEVAKARFPVRHRESLERIHVEVHRQQVVASMGAMLHHALEEEVGMKPLAHEAAERVGDGDKDGVDAAPTDQGGEFGECHGNRGIPGHRWGLGDGAKKTPIPGRGPVPTSDRAKRLESDQRDPGDPGVASESRS